MTETRKLAAILVAGVVGYRRLAGADEDRTLARLRGLRCHEHRGPHRATQSTRARIYDGQSKAGMPVE